MKPRPRMASFVSVSCLKVPPVPSTVALVKRNNSGLKSGLPVVIGAFLVEIKAITKPSSEIVASRLSSAKKGDAVDDPAVGARLAGVLVIRSNLVGSTKGKG